MRWIIAGLAAVLLSVTVLECGAWSSDAESSAFLVVVEPRLKRELESSFEQYIEDLSLEEIDVRVEAWEPATALELRELLAYYVRRHRIEGALFVGEMPYVEFEQDGHIADDLGFPCDIYYQDVDSEWVDTNNNGIYDYHTPLELDLYTSRLTGSVEELREYFDRVHRYRHEGSLVRQAALVFIDNPWCETDTSDNLCLDSLYDEIEIIQDPSESQLERYVAELSGEGFEFVFQKVHAGAEAMTFDDVNLKGETVQHTLEASEVARGDFKASFLNLTNCSAARFSATDQTLGEAFTVGTDYGLAIIGSTKVGHLANSDGFHRNLGEGMRWGKAYKEWYNEEGVNSDKWHLGVVLMGDPLLRVRGSAHVSGGQ